MTDHIQLANGTQIDRSTGKPVNELSPTLVEVPSNIQLQREATFQRRRLADLPDIPDQMNTISVVLSYTIFGLSEDDIASAIGLETEQVVRIRSLDAYAKLEEALIENINRQDLDDVRGLFVQQSRTAANRLLDLAQSETEGISLSATKDILDRAGHRPADVVEHRHSMEGGLTIEFVKRDKTESAPLIDISPKEEF